MILYLFFLGIQSATRAMKYTNLFFVATCLYFSRVRLARLLLSGCTR